MLPIRSRMMQTSWRLLWLNRIYQNEQPQTTIIIVKVSLYGCDCSTLRLYLAYENKPIGQKKEKHDLLCDVYPTNLPAKCANDVCLRAAAPWLPVNFSLVIRHINNDETNVSDDKDNARECVAWVTTLMKTCLVREFSWTIAGLMSLCNAWAISQLPPLSKHFFPAKICDGVAVPCPTAPLNINYHTKFQKVDVWA